MAYWILWLLRTGLCLACIAQSMMAAAALKHAMARPLTPPPPPPVSMRNTRARQSPAPTQTSAKHEETLANIAATELARTTEAQHLAQEKANRLNLVGNKFQAAIRMNDAARVLQKNFRANKPTRAAATAAKKAAELAARPQIISHPVAVAPHQPALTQGASATHAAAAGTQTRVQNTPHRPTTALPVRLPPGTPPPKVVRTGIVVSRPQTGTAPLSSLITSRPRQPSAAGQALAQRQGVAATIATQPHGAYAHLDLTNDMVYRKATLKVHPDHGGSPEAFQELTRAREAQLAAKHGSGSGTGQQLMLTTETTAAQDKAATSIQALIRGRAARKEITAKHAAANRIKAIMKMNPGKNKLTALREEKAKRAATTAPISQQPVLAQDQKSIRAAENKAAGLKRKQESSPEEILAARAQKKEDKKIRQEKAAQKSADKEAALKTAAVVPEGTAVKTGFFRNKEGTINKTRAIGGAALGLGLAGGLGGLAAALGGSSDGDSTKEAAAMGAPLETETANPTQTAGRAYGAGGNSPTFE